MKYEMGLNQFAHFTEDQFVKLYLGMDSQSQNKINLQKKNLIIQQQQQNKLIVNNQILTDVDWQVLGKVSNIKNQGNCDAGYAFSTTSLIQSSLLMQNQNITLSQQQIIDCADNYTTMGCNGGSRIGTIKFAKQKGLSTDKTYPYIGLKGQCKKQTGTYFANFTLLQSNGCNEIKNNLYKSPMTVAVNAKNWQLYKAGIFDNCNEKDDVNHDIYLVGVSLTYWRLKNSWGLRWGQYGYIRLNIGNTCGICSRTGYGYVI